MDATRPRGFERLCLGLLAAAVVLGTLGAVFWPALDRSGAPTVAEVAATPAVGEVAATPAPRPLAPTAVRGLADDAPTLPALQPEPPPAPPLAGTFDLDAVATGAPVPRAAAAPAPVPAPAPRVAAAGPEDPDLELRRLLAQALLAREAVSAERQRLWRVRQTDAAGFPLPAEDRLWLGVLADRYGTDPADLERLARRVDVAPPSILIAAALSRAPMPLGAATETSRAGHQARGREKGLPPPRHLDDALHLLNTDRAFAAFRREREQMRRAGIKLDALRLADALPAAGAGGIPSGQRLVAVIAAAGLGRFDDARLEPAGPPVR